MRTLIRLIQPVTLLLVIPLAACVETATCPEGTGFPPLPGGGRGDTCVPVPDAQVDGGGQGDAGPDASPCGVCSGTTPLCRTSDGKCVACLGNPDCGDTLFCDIEAGACVGCLGDGDCSNPTPVCRAGACAACTAHADCAARGDAPSCDLSSGRCAACSPDTEETRCAGKACDPVTLECTGTDRGSVDTCEPCVADSECVAGHRCIELSYAAGGGGFYCMPLVAAGGCGVPTNQPFTVDLVARPSRSGEAAAIYCGINEALTTCEAVLAALEGQGAGCMDDSACPEGGRCEPVGASGTQRCTYSCNDLLQCPDNPALATCNTSGDRYCGRTP